ncbi:hypothetical protein ACTA71_011105 [Dictyostelium dimigraforme]
MKSSVNVQDISPPGTFYKCYTTDSCYFSFKFLCVSDDGACGTQLSITPFLQSIIVISNSTSVIYSVGFSLPIGNFSYTLYSGAGYLDIECIGIDLEKISFTLKNNYLKYSIIDFSFNTYTLGVYELHGITFEDKAYVVLMNATNNPTCVFFHSCSQFFRLQCYPNSITSNYNLTSNIILTFSQTNNSFQKSFLLEPLVTKEIYNEINNLKYYPSFDGMTNLQLLGYNELPLISFSINNSFSDTIFLFVNNQDYFNPVGGDENSTNFLIPYSDITNSQLYLQNGGFLKSYFNISNISINQYNYETPQISAQTTFKEYYIDYLNYYKIQSLVISFKSNIKYSFSSYDIEDNGFIKTMKFPFGFESGNSSNYTFNISSPVLSYNSMSSKTSISLISNIDSSTVSYSYKNHNTSIVYNNSMVPKITNIQVTHLVSNLYSIRVYAQIPYKFSHFKIVVAYPKYHGPESLVEGDLYNGTFEFIESSFLGITIDIYDIYQKYTRVLDGSYFSINPLLFYQTPSTSIEFNITSIHNISFLYNDIDVSSRRHYNILYFNFSEEVPRDYPIVMVPNGIEQLQNKIYRIDPYNNEFYSSYNETIRLFQIPFYIDANIPTGDYPFTLLFSVTKLLYSGSFDTQLRIKYSRSIDLQGPVFKKVQKINESIYINNSTKYGIFGWLMTIEDLTNGFDSGYITVRGEIDVSTYNFTFTLNDSIAGDVFLGDYRFDLNISYPCISQNYLITEVALYDRMNRISYFSIYPTDSTYSSIFNPFLNYLNDSSINIFQLQCEIDPISSLDTTPPEITYFDIQPSTNVDTSTLSSVEITYQFMDEESGIKKDQLPIAYLSAINNNILECKPLVLTYFEIGVTLRCVFDLPIGFGNGESLLFSVYGAINNNGLFGGASTISMFEKNLHTAPIMKTQFYGCSSTILNYFTLNDKSSYLWLFGRCFGSQSIAVFYVGTNTIAVSPSIIYPSAVKIPLKNLEFLLNKTFDIFLKNEGAQTNSITINPKSYDFYLSTPPTLQPTSTPTPTSTSTPTSTPTSASTSTPTLTSIPLVTNAPQTCSGTPICGGDAKGKCDKDKGCICYPPWVGNECSSQTVTVKQPIFNIGNSNGNNNNNNNKVSPSIEIIVPIKRTNDDSGSNSEISSNTTNSDKIYKSLISIVSLREINFSNNEVFKHTFEDDWESVIIDDSTVKFFNTIKFTNQGDIIIITNITVTLKWFGNQSIVTFANQELVMNPSTLKYTIEITSFPFSSYLNNLELIMSATIQSNTNDNGVCSAKEFGETSSGDNSNYLKIQVEDHSLYGRFIKRGIVDNYNIISISNVLLDSQFKPITEAKSLQSFIGIQIPYYKSSIIIDPDFSILLDSNDASSKSNSICSDTSKKLGTTQIIGIVLGAVGFTCVIALSVTYYIIKKRKQEKFIVSLGEKLKKIDNQ